MNHDYGKKKLFLNHFAIVKRSYWMDWIIYHVVVVYRLHHVERGPYLKISMDAGPVSSSAR